MDFSSWIAIASFIVAIGSNLLWLLAEFQKNNQRRFTQDQRFVELSRNQKRIILMIEELSKK
jgi:hypothetical protein